VTAIVGINAYHGDAAAALVVDGRLVAAMEEERVTRVKHWAGFPRHALRACLDVAGVAPDDIDGFAIGRNPRAHRWRKAAFALGHRPSLRLLVDRARNGRRVGDVAGAIADALGLARDRVRRRLSWVEHHPAHLASAFLASPFEEAAVCAIDGFGDFVSTSWARGRGSEIEPLGRVLFPHSLGLFYLAVTQHLGFPAYGDEYKVMGLAAYGAADFAPAMRKIVALGRGGRFALDLAYFRHWSDGVSMSWDGGEPTIGRVFTPVIDALLGPARRPDEPLEPRHEAIAASVQLVFEEAAFHVLRHVQAVTGLERLCLAGGCAMNSVANGKIRGATPFRHVFVQPAAGDDGTAIGAALHVSYGELDRPRAFAMEHGYWGPAFTDADIHGAIEAAGPALRGALVRVIDDRDALCDWTAERLAEGGVVGWFQGRMEWGARALGNRSILADPRRADMRQIINARIKRREPFRPFAPAVLEEALDEYFEGAAPDAFMMHVYPVRPDKRAIIPAVVHVDGSGRLQTVSRRANPLFWQLLRAWEKRAGVPVLLNTSFNESEPIVNTPAQALDCFLRTGMDAIVLGRTAIWRRPAATARNASP